MQGSEKRINDIKIRLTDSELLTITKLAALDDRTIADYLHHIIQTNLFGLATRLNACELDGNQSHRGG